MRNTKIQHKRRVWLVAAIAAAVSLTIPGVLHPLTASAAGTAGTSSNAYASYDATTGTWTFGSDKVERKIQLAAGKFTQTELLNKGTNVDYASASSPEFSLSVNGASYSSASGGWTLNSWSIPSAANGRVQLDVTLHNNLITITRHYAVYSGSGVTEEWSDFSNTSGSAESWDATSLGQKTLSVGSIAQTDLLYMTGGANFTGSQVLKTVPLTTSYARTFDSYDAPEVATVDGHNFNYSNDKYQGSSVYNQFIAFRNRSTKQGVFETFSVQGHWTNMVRATTSSITSTVAQRSSGLTVPTGFSAATQPTQVGVFSGDVDAMGNGLLNFQYQYKWDATNDAYFAKVKGYQFQTGPQTANAVNAINDLRYIGGDTFHIDDGWYDKKGDWNNLAGDNFAALNAYAKLSGLNMTVWSPPWNADMSSATYQNNPSWVPASDTSTYYGGHLNQANSQVVAFEKTLLDSKQSEWGTYEWRFDGEPVWPNGGSDKDMPAQSAAFYSLLQNFKAAHPDAGTYACSSGGETISVDSSAYSDVQQTSDGAVYHYDGYWDSLITPPDKLTSGPDTDFDRYSWGSTYSPNNHGSLGMSWQVGLQNAGAAVTTADKESLRKDALLYHYLVSKGVAGRWVQVYRPTASATDATYYLQKMNKSLTAGYISMRRNDATVGSSFKIFPKGLIATQTYSVQSLLGSVGGGSFTGAQIMTSGLTVSSLRAGEMIFFNLNDRPGTGTDTTAPTAPASAIRTDNVVQLGTSGTQLSWSPSSDNRLVAYYEIIKNGQDYDKVAAGTSYFDPAGKKTDTYSVAAVDGDDNRSTLTALVAGSASSGNVLTGATVTSSSSYNSQGWSQAALTDGQVGSSSSSMGWTSDSDVTENHTESVTVDGGAVKRIDEVTLYPRTDSGNVGYGFPVDFRVETSADGTNWSTVVARSGFSRPSAAGQLFSFGGVDARFVRVVGTKLQANPSDSNRYRMQFSEIEAGSGRAAANVLSTAGSSASSSYTGGGWSLGAVNDGALNSTGASMGWTSDGSLSSDHQEYIQWDLGKVDTIRQVVLYPRDDSGNVGYGIPNAISIQTSSDGLNWTSAASTVFTQLPSDAGQQIEFGGVSTRYVRIVGTSLRSNPSDSSKYRMQFAEVLAS